MENRKQIGQGIFAYEGTCQWYEAKQYGVIISYGPRKGKVFVDLEASHVNYGIFADEMVALHRQQLMANDRAIIDYVKSQIVLAAK
ncbi:hypothetical protein [Bacillus tropicus]|uniref:hypothetical protein n=1 Tax=Bacillus tropicus TaxID=2026188 RepID=UPI0030EDADE1